LRGAGADLAGREHLAVAGADREVRGEASAYSQRVRTANKLCVVVAAVVRALKAAGAQPFIIPAMGSHGGATPEGQAHVLSEYGITEVDRPIHLNRIFREQGWIAIKDELGLEMIDCGASKVFAVADHQIAHVHCRNAQAVASYLTAVGLKGAVKPHELNIFTNDIIPNGKTDINANGELSTDYVGANSTWATNTYAGREGHVIELGAGTGEVTKALFESLKETRAKAMAGALPSRCARNVVVSSRSPAPEACGPVLGRILVPNTGSSVTSRRSEMPYSRTNGTADSCPSVELWYSKLDPACTAPFSLSRAVSVSRT
jgi:hypothetical protein